MVGVSSFDPHDVLAAQPTRNAVSHAGYAWEGRPETALPGAHLLHRSFGRLGRGRLLGGAVLTAAYRTTGGQQNHPIVILSCES